MNSSTSSNLLEQRLASLEQRVATLEGNTHVEAQSDSRYWLVEALEEGPGIPDGSVIFGGDVTIGNREYKYQWQRPTQFVTDESWEENIKRLTAIAHPTRAEILRRLLCAPASANDLVQEGLVSSTGTTYHHLNELSSAGWIAKSKSGTFEIRPTRVIPLMTIITAAEAH
ncbi:transcriptional regulator [Corynebacterium sp. HMSC036D03]|uniref:ArsR/SmtB family transcription factor n=1 Tax=unclassified Corynebacterium TaxID=2624378 RepID=UPI0008A38301|nr:MULTISPECIES: winged helix-turn-helix domain-containing protein [unclassified Corynebacterium]OFT44885.1 transcriptional regulator [Corynebacterium sp. HMSC06G04]OHO68177.1 transcriptional regulator [Corynebacterium sp. HMSC036D03]